MKRIALFVAMSVVAVGLWGQEASDLQDKYELRKVTSDFSANESDPTSKLWGVSEGFTPINEPTFLRLGGYEDEAQQAANNLLLTNGLWLGWGGMLIGGTLLALVPMWVDVLADSGSFELGWTFWTGIGLITGSLIPVFIASSLPPKITPLGRAQQIARDYNELLLEQLSDETASR